jgi:hypothetical protein
MKNLLLLTIISGVVSLVGIIFVPERAWANLLLANYYLLGLGLAAIIFIAMMYVSNAGWATAIRRVPEAMTSVIPLAAFVMLLLMFGIHHLYEWSHPDVVAHDHLLQEKTAWLNVPFFVVRTIIYLALWTSFAMYIVKLSRKQDTNGNIKSYTRSKTASAIFLVVFAITFSLASMDWIMSLEPHWYSTIFGIYNIIGTFLNGLAVITLIVILLKRMGPFEHVVTSDHLHSLGKLIFAFSTFWMYIWFSQYLLIWYSNIPEEATYMVHRQEGSWLVFTIVNVVFNWAIPFIALLPAWTKKSEGFLLRVCIIIMIGRWIDLFWMIIPPFMKDAPVVNIWELAPLMSAISGFFYITFKVLSKHNLLPVNDPMLVESLPHHS